AVYNNFVGILEDEGAKQALFLEKNRKLIFELFQESKQSQGHEQINRITGLKITKTSKTPKGHKNELMDESKNLNLRTLRHIVQDFEKIFTSLPEIIENKPGLLENILITLTIFSIETRAGEISTSDISKLRRVSISLLADSNKVVDENSDVLLRFVKKWREKTVFYTCVPDLEWWQYFFDNGFINKEYLNQSLLNSESFSVIPNWSKLLKCRSLSDESFNQILLEVESNYSNKTYEDIEILKCITGFFLWLEEIGFYNKNRNEILIESIKYIDYLKTKPDRFMNYTRSVHSSYYTYYSHESQEFKSLCDYIDKVRQDLREENWSNVANELLDAMQQNHEKFKAMITGE
ncbi:MAG: hypothetical protein LH629_06110, partial [Ignavibacteria bacterium]|nr:hypothetical protein [Ignavibacteria bacterium]